MKIDLQGMYLSNFRAPKTLKMYETNNIPSLPMTDGTNRQIQQGYEIIPSINRIKSTLIENSNQQQQNMNIP